MQDDRPSVLLFEGFRFDRTRGCLWGPDGTELLLRPKSFDVLQYLLEHAGRLVSRDELMQAIWRDVIVTDDSITHCITEVRRVLGDEGQRLLKTVPRRGYLLEAEVTRGEARAQAALTVAIEEHQASNHWEGTIGGASSPPKPDLPSLAVLPFANLSGDPEQQYFADGITEELTTALSRARTFLVIARNSAFTYKGRAVDVRQVGRELDVRYVLEGSVRKAGERIRVSAQLVEAQAGYHIWVDRFDSTLDDIFDLQDRVTEAVSAAIEPSLVSAEINRAKAKSTENLDAYDLYLRALSHYHSFSRAGNDTALALLREAIKADPGFTLAKAWAACCHVNRKAQRWSSVEDEAEGEQLAREALAAAGDDPRTLHLAGVAIVSLCREFDAGLAAAERALLLYPNSVQVLTYAAWIHDYACEPAVAVPLFERAMRLSPLDPEMAVMMSGLGIAHLIAGNSGAALHWAQQSIRHTPTWTSGHRVLIVALMALGRETEAQEALAALRRIDPQTNIRRGYAKHYRNPQFEEFFHSMLVKAGVPA